MTEEFREYDSNVANTRRPLVLVVGKTLSQEELKTLIVNEEPLFQMWDKDGKDIAGERWIYDENLELVDTYVERGYCGTLRNIIHRKGFHWLDGYVFCDGTIYGSFYEFKYPEYEEYIGKWELLARRNPFVDMVVAYTDINESPCYACPVVSGENSILDESLCDRFGTDEELAKENFRDCYRDCDGKCLLRYLPQTRQKAFESSLDWWNYRLKRGHAHINENSKEEEDIYIERFYRDMCWWMLPANVHNRVQIVLHIHDGIVETLWGQAAVKCYADYEDRYGDFRMWITHNSDFYATPISEKETKETIFIKFDDKYMRECFRFMGMDERIYDEQIKPKYLINIKGKTQIVTKEWLLSKYDQCFQKTELDIHNVKRIQRRHVPNIRCSAKNNS